jgi:hypothetical protein
MDYFQTQNPNLGKFWSVLDWNMLIYFMSILWLFGIFYDHSGHFAFIWYIFSSFGIMLRKIWQPWSQVSSVCKVKRNLESST